MNPKRVLIVDDNAVLVRGLSNVLKGAGYEVLEAEDGAGAVSTARRERPNLVLLDLSFPPDVAHGGGVAWDGFLIMTWLGRMEEAKDIPIAIISANEDPRLKERALKAGAVAYFQKPFEPEDLLKAVRQILGDSEPEPAAGAEAEAGAETASAAETTTPEAGATCQAN
ncbi:MAG TPA: response regulator [Verrucomicrobiae bacterium]